MHKRNTQSGLGQGKLIPCVGGPLDGQKRPITIIFPFLNGGMANAAFTEGGLDYVRDGDKWVYAKRKRK